MWVRRNWWIQVGVLVVMLLSLVACWPTEERELVYVGKVIDEETKEPIADAKVSLEFRGAPPVVYTDSEGVYRFVALITGTRLDGRVRVDIDGYKKYDRYITLYTTSSTVDDVRLRRQATEGAEPTEAVAQANTEPNETDDTEPTATFTLQPPTPTATATPVPPTATATPTIQPTNTLQPATPLRLRRPPLPHPRETALCG